MFLCNSQWRCPVEILEDVPSKRESLNNRVDWKFPGYLIGRGLEEGEGGLN